MADHAARYPGGGQGRALSYANLVLGVIAPQAYAPGQPLTLEVCIGDTWLSLAGKSQGSRARVDGGFDVKLRLTNLRREARLALEQAFNLPSRG